MITLEQIRLLEERVRRAVDRIATLQEENGELRKKTEEYEARVGELEARIDRFTRDQNQIEDGIKKALDSLEELEERRSAGEPPASGAAPRDTPEESVDQTASEEPDSAAPDKPTDFDDEEADKGSAVEESNELDIF